MANSDPSLFISTQVGGMNNFTAPEFLSEVEYARGVNLSSRSGILHTRPRFTKLSTLPDGKFQGMYTLGSTLYAIVAGSVYM